ncbi:serine hydrolase FSH [Rhexocercosporidium sp. MPI-PUGE-AT-0058]|nr:serine hydrolase FSH [Rhexocercosporidium sp. MPI-PUGE-AT-0058]
MSFLEEPLPRIACFHGGGSTASIFNVQSEQLIKLLSNTFSFVFFDAPFERDAGPGVLPIFTYEKYGPYRAWFARSKEGIERGDGRDEDGKGEGGVERALRLIAEEGGEGEWVGVMGFSQGTRVVGGILLDQQRRKKMGLPRAEGDLDFKFGILCMGASAPMVSDVVHASLSEDLITIPTLHLHGTKDLNYENGKKQLEAYYDQSTATVWDIAYHHAMPWYRADVLKFVEMIRKLYADTKGNV